MGKDLCFVILMYGVDTTRVLSGRFLHDTRENPPLVRANSNGAIQLVAKPKELDYM